MKGNPPRSAQAGHVVRLPVIQRIVSYDNVVSRKAMWIAGL